jgi:glutamate synthase (ferredoxin)
MPFIRQVFIGRGEIPRGMDFERKLYIIRRRAEQSALSLAPDGVFYLPSLSSKTIVYKGMLTAEQLDEFYADLRCEDMKTALALVHSRYSTNTFPSWERAHPNRYLIHNGEINTLRGNINFMHARESMLQSEAFGSDLPKILPVINRDGSDSAMFDNCVEFLTLAGIPIERVMMMMIPEPWSGHESMSEEKKAYYEYLSCQMEPWAGPAAMGFTDGERIGAVLDRNGLRPARYYVTSDDLVVLASEVGVLDLPAEKIIKKERLHPGRMLLIDTKAGRIISDEEIKHAAATEQPYRTWLEQHMVSMESLPEPCGESQENRNDLLTQQKAFGYSYEDLRMILLPMARDAVEPVGAMGNDTPLAVLSNKPVLLYDYFKSLFAQVTNPPIDALREELITSSIVLLGSEGNLIHPTPEICRRVKLRSPIIGNKDLQRLKSLDLPGLKSAALPILFEANGGAKALEAALDRPFQDASEAVRGGATVLILSDRGVDAGHAAIPALLAVSGLHHHLIREGIRTRTSLVLESGEPREVHHFSCLIGFGASAINPYLALRSVEELTQDGSIPCDSTEDAVYHYLKSASKGVIKTLSKMGISTVQSYLGAQIFEAVGLSQALIDKYFTSTPSPIGGIGLEEIAHEALMRHENAFRNRDADEELPSGGQYQYRRCGEYHMFNPETIHKLQQACRTGDYGVFKEYSKLLNENEQRTTLRSLLRLKESAVSIPWTRWSLSNRL